SPRLPPQRIGAGIRLRQLYPPLIRREMRKRGPGRVCALLYKEVIGLGPGASGSAFECGRAVDGARRILSVDTVGQPGMAGIGAGEEALHGYRSAGVCDTIDLDAAATAEQCAAANTHSRRRSADAVR